MIRIPMYDADLLQLGVSTAEEEQLMQNLTSLKVDRCLNHALVSIAGKYAESIEWHEFHRDYDLKRISNAFRFNMGIDKADHRDVVSITNAFRSNVGVATADENNAKFEPVEGSLLGTMDIHRMFPFAPSQADELKWFFRFYDESPILVAPVYDFDDGCRLLRGCNLFNTGTKESVVLDASVMGDQIFEVSTIVMTSVNTFIFWDQPTFDDIRWKCALRFPRVFLVKDCIPGFPPDASLRDLHAALGFTTRVAKFENPNEPEKSIDNSYFLVCELNAWFQRDDTFYVRPKTSAAVVFSAIELEMLRICLSAIIPRAPNFVKRGIRNGNAVNSKRLQIGLNKEKPPIHELFSLIGDKEQVSLGDVLRRFEMSMAVIKPGVFDLSVYCGRDKQPDRGMDTLCRRARCIMKLKGKEAQEGVRPVEMSNQLLQTLKQYHVQPQTEIFIAATVPALEREIDQDSLVDKGPLLLTPIVASEDEDVPCRGVVLLCHSLNKLYILDSIESKLAVYPMADMVDRLQNVKFVWSEWDARKLRLELGMNLLNTVIVRPGLGEFQEEHVPGVFAPAMLFMGRQKLENIIQIHVVAERRNTDKDLSIAMLSTSILGELISFSTREIPGVITTAATETVTIISAKLLGYIFPAAAEALAATVEIANVEPSLYQFTSDGLHQFHRAYLSRWFESNEQGIPQEKLISSLTLLRFGTMPVLGKLSEMENEDHAWRELIQTSELRDWPSSRTRRMRKRLAAMVHNSRQCKFCPIPPNAHLIGCLFDSIIETEQRRFGGPPQIAHLLQAANAFEELQQEHA